MSFKFNILSTIAALCIASAAQAVTITGYDIRNADTSGSGGWDYTYTGSITPSAEGIPGLVDLVGGTGTLADGILPTSTRNNQLFVSENSVGNASITLYFDRAVRIESIDFLNNPAYTNNSIPGRLLGVAAIGLGGDFFDFFDTIGFGPVGASGQPVSDRIDLTGTELGSFELDSITLRGFVTSSNFGFGPFSIGEIVVNESVAPVPLPASGLLLLAGLGGLGLARRRAKG